MKTINFQTVLSQQINSSIPQSPKKDNKLPFSLLTSTYEKVGNCKGQNSKNVQKALLTNLFKTLIRQSTQDLIKGYWLSILKIGPDYQKNQLGIGKQILMKAIVKSCGVSQKQLRQKQTQYGDLGQATQQIKSNQKTIDSFLTKKKNKQILTIQKIYSTLQKIVNTKGNNSNIQKQNLLMNLLLLSNHQQIKFIIRWVEGNLKIAAAQKTMQKALITALFQQLVPHPKQTQQQFQSYQSLIKKSLSQYPNDAQIIKNVIKLKQHYQQLEQLCKLTLSVPCRPMLAKPTRGIPDILNRFQGKQFTCQYKYDGLRGQIHYQEGNVLIFSRNLQNLTPAYTDIVQQLTKNSQQLTKIGLKSFILDCQIVAINKKTKQLLPFQILSTRTRKTCNVDDIQVNVNLFAFDVLFYNQPITHLPLHQRRKYLNGITQINKNIIQLIEHRQLQNLQLIDQFFQQSIKFGTQGLMIKNLHSPYTCSKRSWQWVKLKKDYINGLGDTLDVIPIAAFYGIGKRTGYYGSFLLATYNPDMQIYQTICKIGTGFSDQVLKSVYDQLKNTTTITCPKQYKISPSLDHVDVWLSPTVVWEIKGADFQLSPVHTCAINQTNQGKGIGLRFPRLIKVRRDKKPIEATTNQFVYDLYKQQAVVQNKVNHDEQDDYY